MMNHWLPIKCEICGQFVSYDDLHSGRVRHKLVTPDSEYTNEAWETYHTECRQDKQMAEQ